MINQLLSWPQQLRVVQLTCHLNMFGGGKFAEFQAALSLHRDTLESITTDNMCLEDGLPMDLRGFVALKTLHLSECPFPKPGIGFEESIAELLIAPQLEVFKLGIPQFVAWCIQNPGVTESDLEWLLAFGQYAISKNPKFHTIHIESQEWPGENNLDHLRGVLEKLEHDLNACGIRLDYDSSHLRYIRGPWVKRAVTPYWEAPWKYATVSRYAWQMRNPDVVVEEAEEEEEEEAGGLDPRQVEKQRIQQWLKKSNRR